MIKSFNRFSIIDWDDKIEYKFPIDILFEQESDQEQATNLNTDFISVIFDQLAEYYHWPIDDSGLIITKNKYIAVKTKTNTYKLPIPVPLKYGNVLKDILPLLAKFYNWEKVEEEVNGTK